MHFSAKAVKVEIAFYKVEEVPMYFAQRKGTYVSCSKKRRKYLNHACSYLKDLQI